MRKIVLLTPVLLGLTLMASCSSPPKPPAVDESRRRPVNTPMAVELQACRNNLQNARLQATESGRLAEAATATLDSLAKRQQVLNSLQEAGGRQHLGNRIYTIRFDFGSTRVDVPAEAARLLVAEAMEAPLVLLRGRTDGLNDAPAESRVARNRAIAVRDYLVEAGIDASRIRTTYQPAGDHVADNQDAGGRALNRRVEIEIYRALPVALSTGTTAR